MNYFDISRPNSNDLAGIVLNKKNKPGLTDDMQVDLMITELDLERQRKLQVSYGCLYDAYAPIKCINVYGY